MTSCKVCLGGKTETKETLTVLQVGGCDKLGDCGVMMSDGSVSKASYPVAGQQIQVNVCK